MAKLVDNEYTVRPFLPKLLPGLIKIEPVVADPEARGVVNKAIKTLREVGKVPENSDGSDLPPIKVHTASEVSPHLVAAIKKVHSSTPLNKDSPLVVYVSQIAANLINARNYEATEWESALVAYVSLGLPDADKAKEVVREVLDKSASAQGETVAAFDDEEEGEDLCNCTFSLAYGAKVRVSLRCF